ncbi:MAG TPA: CopD family protein [Gemmatimonadaceae bacterium]|nr:CopD family protein [Gemmatimonadaceae bacterium]
MTDKDALARRAARLGGYAALLLLVGAGIRLWDQYANLVDPTMTGGERWQFFGAMTLHTQWGRIWIASVVLAIIAWIGFAKKAWPVMIMVALALAATPSLAGHAMGDKAHPIVTIAADAIHVTAASAWLGTLFVMALVVILPRHGGTLTCVRAFSPTALIAASTLAITGLWAAYVHVGTWAAVLGSSYGRTLCIKLVCVACVAAVGAYNWRWATPRLAAGHERAMTNSARAELVFGALVLLVTAILVATPLPMEM